MPKTEIEAYALLVERAYGNEVKEEFDRILDTNDTPGLTLDSALDQARSTVYGEQNKIAATSGNCCFDSDGDLL